jgi:hypothetical protein
MALVISAQCSEMPELEFLPPRTWHPSDPITLDRGLPIQIYEQLIDPTAGRCRPVPFLDDEIPDIQLSAPGLVINPTVDVARHAVRAAMAQAHMEEAALVIHYIGHGYAHQRGDGSVRHFLQVADTTGFPSSTQQPSLGWDPYYDIDEIRDDYPHLSGLVLLIDACYASTAVPTIRRWIDANVAFPFVWLGSSQVTQAFDGCFSKVIRRVAAEGIARGEHERGDLVSDLGAEDVMRPLTTGCCGQEPATVSSQAHDPVLFIAGNRAAERRRLELGVDSITGQAMAQLLERYQAVGLAAVVDRARGHPLSVVIGDPGSGKSSLAAALRDPPGEAGLISVDGLAFLTATSTAAELSETLSMQLRTIRGFDQAAEIFADNNRSSWSSLSRAEQVLLGPLGVYSPP